jgi:hypothetical protein
MLQVLIIGQDPELIWELDALEPPVIDSLLDTVIREIVNPETRDAALRNEEREKIRLAEVAAAFEAE